MIPGVLPPRGGSFHAVRVEFGDRRDRVRVLGVRADRRLLRRGEGRLRVRAEDIQARVRLVGVGRENRVRRLNRVAVDARSKGRRPSRDNRALDFQVGLASDRFGLQAGRLRQGENADALLDEGVQPDRGDFGR